ncbi:hypothetical protein [Bacteroides acidifaciens]|uniref:hypothetical protein n=1 Tax=Bacteroides acidifaciens TaxID=85831 RepID=UPI003F6942CF
MKNRNESAALTSSAPTGQGRLFSDHGQNIRQGKGHFHKRIRVQVQNPMWRLWIRHAQRWHRKRKAATMQTREN